MFKMLFSLNRMLNSILIFLKNVTSCHRCISLEFKSHFLSILICDTRVLALPLLSFPILAVPT